MKNKILEFLTTDRDYARGVQLFMLLGKSISLKKQFNNQPESPAMKELLFEQFRVMLGFTREKMKFLLAKPVQKIIAYSEPVEKQPELTIKQKVERIPINVITGFKLREEFPFLKEKDCPDVLKIMVADLNTAFDEYRQNHELLFTAENEELIRATFATLENYLENRQIWDELNHYKTTGEILGVYKVAQAEKIQDEIDKMNPGQLHKLANNLASNISKIKKKLANNPGHESTGSWTESLKECETKLEKVKNRLPIE